MGIRRGTWRAENFNKAATVNNNRHGPKPVVPPSNGQSRSENHMLNRTPGNVDEVTAQDGVSDYRQEQLIRATSMQKDGNTPTPLLVNSASYKQTQKMREHFVRNAAITSDPTFSGGATSFSGTGGTVRQAPEVYSPLFQIANLQLPRDRITMNAWNRNFYDTHPLVHNCINLHATYPIGKINIKCKDRKVQQFFEEQCEELDIINVLQAIALEFWKMGEKIQGDSLLTMGDGRLKEIKNIEIGDEVITHLGNKKKVIGKFKKPTCAVVEDHLKIFKIHISGLPYPLIISGKHPILSTNKEYFICDTPSCAAKGMRVLPGKIKCSNCKKPAKYNTSNPDFAFSDELQVKDMVYAPFNNEVEDNLDIDEDFCYLIGQWLAEGCYCKAKRKKYTKLNGIKFCNYDKKYVEGVLEPTIKKCFGYEANTYISESNGFSKNKNKYDVWYEAEYKNGPKIAEFFLEHCGEYSNKKTLSAQLMQLPTNKQVEILAGFIDGDGNIDKQNGHASLFSASKNLSNQIALILRRLGAKPSVSRAKRVYKVRINANDAFNIFKGKLRSDKNKLLRRSKWSSAQSAIENNAQLLTITKIEDVTEDFYDEYMYDIEVEDDHSYIANGIAVHNCFPYAELDESRGMWKNVLIQNPDYIHIKTSVLGGDPVISMRPDAALQRLVQSHAPADIQLRQQIDEEVLYHVKKGNNIPLDNFHISHLKMLSSPYDTHGTSVIVSIYKDLMLYDKLRESKFAQADNLVNPITLVKVGGTAEGEFHPTPEALEQYRQIFESAQYDKDFKIITHAGVSVERVGASGQIIDIGNDMNFIMDNILNGLMVPKAVITQEGASFNSASVGLEVLKQRYESFRNMISQWLIRKIFAPISEIQEFYEYRDGEKKLIVPEIDWNTMILYDMDNYINVINGLVQNQIVSRETLFRSLGLNADEERRKIREQMINDIIMQKEGAELQKMSLGALRSIGADDEIIEQTEAPLPGTPGAEEAGIPGAAPGAGGLMGPAPLGGGGLGGGAPLPPTPPTGGPGGGGLGPPGGGGPIGGPGGPGPGAGGGGGGAPPPTI